MLSQFINLVFISFLILLDKDERRSSFHPLPTLLVFLIIEFNWFFPNLLVALFEFVISFSLNFLDSIVYNTLRLFFEKCSNFVSVFKNDFFFRLFNLFPFFFLFFLLFFLLNSHLRSLERGHIHLSQFLPFFHEKFLFSFIILTHFII